jgi:hypothetical protein
MTKRHLPLILLMLATTPALAAPDADPNPRPARPNNAGMMRYDANKDGFVDRSEWSAGQDARFKQLDTDKDGRLSKDEMFSRARQAPGQVMQSDRQLERQDRFFQQVDRNRDGFVSKDEFIAQADRNFTRCDLDKDGRTNTAECRQALRRPPADRVRQER